MDWGFFFFLESTLFRIDGEFSETCGDYAFLSVLEDLSLQRLCTRRVAVVQLGPVSLMRNIFLHPI